MEATIPAAPGGITHFQARAFNSGGPDPVETKIVVPVADPEDFNSGEFSTADVDVEVRWGQGPDPLTSFWSAWSPRKTVTVA